MAGSFREVQVQVPHGNVRTIKISNSPSPTSSVSLKAQDIIFPSVGGGYTYRGSGSSNRALRNRFINWKLSQNTLELVETSLDIELYGNNLKVGIAEGTILPNVFIYESTSSVSILIATTSSVHRLVFPHPSKGRQESYFQSGINASLASIFNTPPSGTNQSSNWNLSSFPQHCNGFSAFLGVDDRCYFSMTTETGALLLVILSSMISDKPAEINELKHASMMHRLWTGLVPTVFRGDNSLCDGTQCSVIHSIGDTTMIFALCRDLKIRIWSSESLECIEVIDLIPLIPDDLDTQQGVAQAFIIKKAVDEKEGRLFIAAYLNFSSQSQFCVFEIFDSDQGIEMAHVSSFFASSTSLLDFTLTPKFIWAMYALSDGESALQYASIEGGLDKDTGWHPVHSQPLDTSEVYIPMYKEPREIYLDHLFYPGRFSKEVITKAMQMLSKTADFDDSNFSQFANSTPHELKEEIIKLMDSEVQRTALDYEVGHTEYHNLQLQCWSKFYSSVSQYSQVERKPIGLFADHVSGLVSIVRQEYQGYVYRSNWLEHLYLTEINSISGVEEFILDATGLQDEAIAKDIIIVTECMKSVSLQFPESIIDGLIGSLESNEDIMPLVDKIVDAITTNCSDKDELIADPKFRAEYMRDVESNFQLLVHHVKSLGSICDALDPAKWVPGELDRVEEDSSPGMQYFDKKQLFCSPLARSVVCETIMKKAQCYMEICRDLLITLKIMARLSSRAGLDLNGADIINTEYIVRIHRIFKAYFTIVWLGRQPVIPADNGLIESSMRKLATLELTEVTPLTKFQGEGITSRSLLHFFVVSVGVPHAIDLINSTLCATPMELKKKSSEIWTTDFKLMIDFIIRALWPLKNGTLLPEFLLSQSQFTTLQSYLYLCKDWCNENKGSREFLLGEAYLGSGQFQKALECFVKAAGSIGYKEDLLTRLVPSDIGDKQDMIVQYFIKVMRLFEQSDSRELVVVVAATALAVAKKTDLNIPMLWSNVFKYNLELGCNKEAYAAITQNPDSSRRRDCLHHFIVTLCERGELQEICEFPYAKLEDDVVSIIETRARTVDITVNKYYDLLYAFHIFKGDFRRAATSMYEYGCRLRAEMHGLPSLQKQAKCYLAAINCLHLVDMKYAWIVRPREKESSNNTEEVGERVNHSPKRKEDGEEIWPSLIPKRTSVTKKTVIVELGDLEKEYSLLVARLNLIKRGKETNAVVGPGMSAIETISLLTQVGLFDSAFSLATTFKVPLESIFEGLATKCVNLTYGVARREVPENAWDWLTANDLGNAQYINDVSTAEQSWRLLKSYLQKFTLKNGSIYYKPIASRLLSLGSTLPAWFINKYKEANMSELLQLYVNYDLLSEASELALEYIDALLGVGKEYFGLKTALHATTPSVWLPYSAIDQLLLALKQHYETSSEIRKHYDQLNRRLEVYFNKVQVVSKDMIEMHYRKQVACRKLT